MAEPTIQLGGGNWAGKSGNLLGYYEQNKKFYAEDFTFSRSTTGTYTDSDGYIQEMPYNLVTYSESFGGSAFFNSTQNLTVINNNAVAPNGTTTAAKLTSTANGARLGTANLVPSILSPSTTYTFSVYVKNINAANYYVRTVSATPSNNVEYTISTTEWTRIEHTFTTSASATYIRLVSDLAEGESILVWGAQVVKGTSAKTYFPTTTRLNMPRVDYLNNSNGSLILEPQSTNLVTYSEDFSQWGESGSPTLTSGQLAPDGTLGATKISGTIGSSYIALGSSSSTTATRSIYARTVSGTGTAKLMSYFGNTNNLFTLTEEWQRFELTGSTSVGGTSFYIDLRDSSQTLNEFIIWGAQSEELSYATSYIPTSGSSVTRNADACSITDVADRINSTEGTIYVEMAALANDSTNRYISINNGTSSKRIIFKFGTSSNNISALGLGTASSFNMSYSGTTITNMNKIALKYKANDCALWVNGEEVATDSTFTAYAANTLNKITFSNFAETGQFLEANVKNFMLYNTALTDSELATLTTL